MDALPPVALPRWRFDRHELAGSFGDIGTDLPLLIALVATCGVDPASACVVFGALQIGTGLLYGIPMPVQPLKAMASIMIAQRLDPGTMTGGGLAIGVIMLVLTLTGLLDSIVNWVPKQVVRGIQLGLGTSLAGLALGMVTKEGGTGYVLSAACVAALLMLRAQRRFPAPLLVIGFGILYALVAKGHALSAGSLVGLRLPSMGAPSLDQVRRGVLLLALPQLPLSIGNSVIATSQTTGDLFPRQAVSVKKIGFTYAVMNLIAPWFGGVPVCHGCGGLVGFYGFGARTGGAPIIYGALYLVIGLLFSSGFAQVVHLFPMPLLGVVLLFEAVGLMTLVRDIAADSSALWVAFAVAAAVVGLPYGYAVGLVLGTVIARGAKRGWLTTPAAPGPQSL